MQSKSVTYAVRLVTPNHKVLFGLGLEAGVHQVSEMLGHARVADEAGLDFLSIGDHPYFAVLERDAAFNYLVPPGDTISDMTLWAHEVAPAVREAIATR